MRKLVLGVVSLSFSGNFGFCMTSLLFEGFDGLMPPTSLHVVHSNPHGEHHTLHESACFGSSVMITRVCLWKVAPGIIGQSLAAAKHLSGSSLGIICGFDLSSEEFADQQKHRPELGHAFAHTYKHSYKPCMTAALAALPEMVLAMAFNSSQAPDARGSFSKMAEESHQSFTQRYMNCKPYTCIKIYQN